MTERIAFVAYASEQDGKTQIVFGEGDHSCERWEISPSLRRKLLQELFEIEARSWGRA